MSGVPWVAADAVKATGGISTGDWAAVSISIDSRSIQPGDLFVALQGPTFDGHDFVADAFTRGAVAAMVSRKQDGVGPYLIVEDTLKGLQDLARFARTRSSARVIALTGSVGKTGVKEALRHVLSFQGETHASLASFNNHWGAPLSLALLPEKARYGIFELGMNHAGEIEPLSKLVRPHVALITNVHPVHIGNLGSIEAIAQAKAEIFVGLEPDGHTVINAATNCADMLIQASPVKPFIFAPDFSVADAFIKDVELDESGTTVTAYVFDRYYTYRVPIPGLHHAENSLAVLLTVAAIGANVNAAAEAYATMTPVGGRGDRITVTLPAGTITLIDETHNASPVATAAALKVLGMMPKKNGRRIAVLGDMLELGPDSERFHTDLAKDIVAAGVDLVFLSGSNMVHLHDALPTGLRGAHAPDSTALLPHLISALTAGDIVLVKGSRGAKMKVITEGLKGAAHHAL